ncbi:hypothetical protein AGABI1DRAFT_77800 [Agaricus bisporus var. burnettii JB137-S8]|uniref:CENP-V/GFA domain-containing protein n=1 Tax=Agaricus bisporus var. burnettii (strain JB137-S8 / ATCC MYA-4627 / FGSC 10392) TaxID=597362 RepID=K5X280_AGABU|nr:uncharacterized protein AGABI1DRAFT_77800 [Agaricus bisporus var. burnettii JB137-S8]EKM77017.1 hypothetical protein AGABI1DRAFT_77800 [Agaricus bisporus var. burnettii JB137-S8]
MEADNTTTTTTSTTPEPSPPVFEGSCFCRSLSWRLEGEPLISIYCHCTICQRMNGAAFVHGLHFPFSSFSWTHSNSDAVAISQPTSSHPWVIYRCKTCHSYIGATNSNSKVWSLKSAHLKRDPTTNLIKDFDKIKPTAHIFYKTRMLDVPDGLPKWDGYENQSNRLDLP